MSNSIFRFINLYQTNYFIDDYQLKKNKFKKNQIEEKENTGLVDLKPTTTYDPRFRK